MCGRQIRFSNLQIAVLAIFRISLLVFVVAFFLLDARGGDMPMPNDVLAWDSLSKNTNIVATAGPAIFNFCLTNTSGRDVAIREILPSCGCTTVQSPSLPWHIAPDGAGRFSLIVNLEGKARKQTKTVEVVTDRGYKFLTLNLTILPPFVKEQAKAQRERTLGIAKADRQAIFHGDCVRCHVKPDEHVQDGRLLYYSACAVCHESKNPLIASPDLFAINTPTNVDFWFNWISHSKPHSIMPAFSKSEGGPLTDLQIAYLARFLNTSDNRSEP